MIVILRANDEAPGRARAALTRRLSTPQRVVPDVLDRLTLAVSELVTNAERASRSMRFPFIIVYASWPADGGYVDLKVWDASWKLPRDSDRQTMPQDDEISDSELPEHGNGILIIEAIASPVGWHRYLIGKTGVSRVAA
jgi:anti-sigma regulatory factor (Ser/Thr protein kinase)